MAAQMAQFRDRLINSAEDFGSIKLVRLKETCDPAFIRNVFPMLRGKFTDMRFAVVGATLWEGKPTLSVFLSQPLVEAGLNAGQMIKSAARHIQGGGGGQPWMATAGGRDPQGLPAAMEEMIATLEEKK
jgi:alanyl-tRNA synthetase